MTKKRFIKLLMSHGEPIHTARAIAFLYNSRNISYKEAYSDYLTKIVLTKAFSKLSQVAKTLGDNVKNVAQSFKKLAEELYDTKRNN